MSVFGFQLTDDLAAALIEAVHSRKPVVGLTHTFYRYPARFSPLFARAMIKAFTQPGDIVMDPFMGGGTTLVEACFLGRRAIGIDISSLATFVSRVKTTFLSEADVLVLRNWANGLNEKLNVHLLPVREMKWIETGYQRNISGRKTWPIRKILELALFQIDRLPAEQQQEFVRCVLLKTAQWALDCRRKIPSVNDFRERFLGNFAEMIEGAREFAAARNANHLYSSRSSFQIICLNRSVIGIETEPKVVGNPPPKLILTSPPYPGVHVLYHRWQVEGRKETPAPFWIANSLDGNRVSFYTFGGRKQQNLTRYYEQLHKAFASLAKIGGPNTLLVQMVAFFDPSWQLSKYLRVIEQTGFSEISFPALANSPDGRLWRYVPNRKWYANQKGVTASSKEAVLFHRLA